MEAIEVVVASFAAKAATHAAVLKRERNSRRAISNFPDELLVDVFGYLQRLPTRENPLVQQLKQLAEVCTHWWRVVVSTPSLWAHISDSDPHFGLALRRSRTHPLDISYLGELPFRLFSVILLPRQCKSFSVICEDIPNVPIHDQPWLPTLVHLKLVAVVRNALSHPEDRDVDVIIPPNMQHLQSLSTRYIRIRRAINDGARLAALTLLSVQWFECSVGAFQVVLDLIQGTQALEELVLVPNCTATSVMHPFGDAVEDWESILEHFPSLSLPKVRRLKIKN